MKLTFQKQTILYENSYTIVFTPNESLDNEFNLESMQNLTDKDSIQKTTQLETKKHL